MIINGTEWTIGADPEIFVEKDGVVVSAHGLVDGNKNHPFKVSNGAVQVDGMALEFNIDPATNYEQFSHNLSAVQAQLDAMVEGYDFSEKTSNVFDLEYLKNQPMEAVMLGCGVDYEGWSGNNNPSPDSDSFMRTVGGHVHVGGFTPKVSVHEDEHFYKAARLATLIDETVGVYSLLWDKDDDRRNLYGKAGAFRPKPYGMEYRPLSNKWIFNGGLVKFVFDGVCEAISRLPMKKYKPNPSIQNIINNGHRDSPFFKNNPKADQVMKILEG